MFKIAILGFNASHLFLVFYQGPLLHFNRISAILEEILQTCIEIFTVML